MNIHRWSSQEKMAKTGVAEILRNSGIPEKFGMKRQFELFKILIFSFYRKNLDIKNNVLKSVFYDIKHSIFYFPK